MTTVRITRNALTRSTLAALSGLLAGFASLAVAELVSAAVRPEASPVTAVGGAAIDRTPAGVKDWAIRNFGEDDKLVLQLGILVTLALFALAVGLLALRYRRVGSAAVLVFGVVGTSAAISRPDSTGLADGLPSLLGRSSGRYCCTSSSAGSPARTATPVTSRTASGPTRRSTRPAGTGGAS